MAINAAGELAATDDAEAYMIQLDEKFRIEKDTASWNLVQKVSEASDKNKQPKYDEQGNRVWNEDVTYHANLKQALITYLDLSLSGSTDVQGVVSAITEAESRIQAAVIKV